MGCENNNCTSDCNGACTVPPPKTTTAPRQASTTSSEECTVLTRSNLCNVYRTGVAQCDLEHFLKWVGRKPRLVVSGTAANGVWTLNSTGTAVARFFEVPVLGDYCHHDISLTVAGAVRKATISLIPVEIALNQDGSAADTFVDVLGRIGGVGSELLEVKDGRCSCRPVCAGCTWPMASNGRRGGFLLVVEPDPSGGPIVDTQVIEYTYHLAQKDCTEEASKCSAPTGPCGREPKGQCYVTEDLLQTSKETKPLGFCAEEPAPFSLDDLLDALRKNPEAAEKLANALTS